MGRGTREDLQRMLVDPDRLDADVIETVQACMESVLNAADDYAPTKDKPLRMSAHEIEAELKALATSILRTVGQVKRLSGEALGQIDLAMPPKADLDIEGWGERDRTLLKSWFETDEWKFEELRLISAALEKLALHAAKNKQPPNGVRLRSCWVPKPAHILLWTIAEDLAAMSRPITHAKPIGDVVHQWATEDNPDNCISLQAWKDIQSLLK